VVRALMIILGIDPGLSGALAFYDTVRGDLEILDMPTLRVGTGSKRVVDEDILAREIDCRSSFIHHAFLEQVGTRPGEGAVGAFSFGMGFGILKGVLAANLIPRTLVRPQEWKKALRVPAEKDGARARASQLLPAHAGKWVRVKDDGRAEAAMICLWGASKL
jgi:crossover junction endodeoxyribonuclease RuvC